MCSSYGSRSPTQSCCTCFLASRAGRAQLLRLQNGVGTVNLSADELLQVEVPLLPAATQRDLAARYAPISRPTLRRWRA